MAPNASDLRQLEEALGRHGPELRDALKKIREAAEEEYLAMILGRNAYTRGQDIREFRLFLLIKHLYGGQLPKERAISSLFQTTAGQSRGLLRAVLSKFQYKMREGLEATLKDVVDAASATQNGATRRITADSENLVAQLNLLIFNLDPTLTPVSKTPLTVGTYDIPAATYDALRAHFGL